MNYTTIKSIFKNHLLNTSLPVSEFTFSNHLDFSVTHSFEADNMIGFKAKAHKSTCLCSNCNSSLSSKGWRSKVIYYSTYNTKPVIIEISYQRFCCSKCKKSFTNQPIQTSGQKSTKLCDVIIDCFREKETFAKISRAFKLSRNGIVNIFDKHAPSKVNEVDCSKVKAIGIDENKLLSIKEKYQTIIVDHEKNRLVEILPNRYKTDVKSWLASKPFQEGIYVTQDMWKPFEDAVRASLTHPIIIADCFHFARQGMWAFNRSRIVTQKEEGFKTNKYWRLLNIRYTKLNKNGKAKLFKILLSSRELLKAYILKEQFLKMVSAKSPIEYYRAENRFLDQIKKYNNEEFKKVIATLINWRVPILNMVRNKNLSNGAIERINRDLKQLRNISFGLQDLKRLNLRAKLLINNTN